MFQFGVGEQGCSLKVSFIAMRYQHRPYPPISKSHNQLRRKRFSFWFQFHLRRNGAAGFVHEVQTAASWRERDSKKGSDALNFCQVARSDFPVRHWWRPISAELIRKACFGNPAEARDDSLRCL